MSDPALVGQLAFEITPEALKPVYMGSLAVGVLPLAVFDDPMNISLGGDPGIALPGIGTNGRSLADTLEYQGLQRFGLGVGYDLSPHLAAATEDAEDGCFGRAPASLGAPDPF